MSWFIPDSKNIHGPDTFDYSETKYLNLSTDVILKCNQCLRRFSISPIHHLYGIKKGCSYCDMNPMQKRIYDYLTKLDIEFIQDYWFVDGKIINYHYDFYLPVHKAIIEYDEELGHSGFIAQDILKIKADYCKGHKISYLRIHHIDYEYIEQGIDKFLKKIKTKGYTRIFSRPEEYKAIIKGVSKLGL